MFFKLEQLALNIPTKKKFGLHNFVKAEVNLDFISFIQETIENGNTDNFYIQGKAKSGKTHLLQYFMQLTYEDRICLDLSNEQGDADNFFNQVTPSTLKHIENYRLICIDNLDFILKDDNFYSWWPAIIRLLKSLNNNNIIIFSANIALQEFIEKASEFFQNKSVLNSKPEDEDFLFDTNLYGFGYSEIDSEPKIDKDKEKLATETSLFYQAQEFELYPITDPKDIKTIIDKQLKINSLNLNESAYNFLEKKFTKNLADALNFIALIEKFSLISKKKITRTFMQQLYNLIDEE